MKIIKLVVALLVFVATVSTMVACGEEAILCSNSEVKKNEELDIDDVIPVCLGKEYAKHFVKYTKIITPNGGVIHIVAQECITNEQMVRCRNILKHYLTDYPNSTYGYNKSEIANKMAENRAILCLLNGEDNGKNELEVDGQPLYQNEIQVEGGNWYMTQNYDHRDAAFEEILHFVHDYGIGVDGKNSYPGAAPELQATIRAAQINALNNGIWGDKSSEWIKELTAENSLSQEYLAAVVDCYYGLWGAWTEENKSMWGEYLPKVRSDIEILDPMGYEIVNNLFFHPYLTYNARIDSNFNGIFSLRYDETKSYTNHSQYLKDVTLLGTNNSSVVVNELDNDITGNEGDNSVVFSGKKEDYIISKNGADVLVVDNVAGRDGRNTIRGVEKLLFSDTEIYVDLL